MRTVRFSLTFNDQFNELLEQGEHRFGIERFLARHPNAKRPDPAHGLCAYPIDPHLPGAVRSLSMIA
jgi:hypothetical protein